MYILAHLLKNIELENNFVCSDLNNFSLLIYFQYHYYLTYRVNDVRITKKEIYFNLNSHHNAASFETIFNRKKKKLLQYFWPLLNLKEDLKCLKKKVFLSI